MEMEGFVDISAIMHGGVYALLYKGEVVYIGQSAKLHARIATHVTYKGRPRKQMMSPRALPSIRFDQIMVMPCVVSDLDRFEKELIEKYQPRYNIKRNPKPTPPMDLLLEMLPAPMLPQSELRQSSFRRR